MKKRLSIQQINEQIKAEQYTEEDVSTWRRDERKGVQQLVHSLELKREKQQLLQQQFVEMSTYEHTLEQEGCSFIAGVDEAGRGPLAGPVVAAAVILPTNCTLYGLTDSKQLTEKQRDYFDQQIKQHAISYEITFVSTTVIDNINIYEATKKAMIDSIDHLDVTPDHVLIDAVPIDIDLPKTVIEKGDQKSISIAAASVLAKVARDRYMEQLDQKYPVYQFSRHKGYGTKVHLDMLRTHGITPYHRKTFAPVKQMAALDNDA